MLERAVTCTVVPLGRYSLRLSCDLATTRGEIRLRRKLAEYGPRNPLKRLKICAKKCKCRAFKTGPELPEATPKHCVRCHENSASLNHAPSGSFMSCLRIQMYTA